MAAAGMLFLGFCVALAEDGSDDVVRLRSGRVVMGSVSPNETGDGSLLVRPWDGDGVFIVRSSQLVPGELDRLLGVAVPAARPEATMIDGIRVITFSRVVEGVLVREEADRVLIKTSESRAPLTVPKAGLVGRMDHVELPEAAAYDAEERVERRLARLKADDDEGLVALAGLASRWGLPAKAKELYRRAASLRPARAEEIQTLIAACEALARERQASALLAEIDRSARKADYGRALALAKTLQTDWADTSAARENHGLGAKLEAEAREWKEKKGDVLARLVPDAYRRALAERISKAARQAKFAEARAPIPEMDLRVVEDLVREFRSSPEEIRAAWDRRERKVRTVGFAAGSWIVLNGQDGGLDSDAKFIPVQRNQALPPPPPVDLGVKLDTAQEWWAKAGSFDRRDWIEAEYARTSTAVVKKAKDRHCSRCVGEGTLPLRRMSIDITAKCPRCHGVKTDQSVEYQ